MLFGVDDDRGATIRCHLVPDAGGATPALSVRAAGRELAVVEASEVLPALVTAGRHATGLCGFRIDAVPGLADHPDLELREARSGLLVYRRPQPTRFADAKVFRLETHLLPLRRFDEGLRHRFQYWYEGIERHGLETATHLFRIPGCSSLYLSGRMGFPGVQSLVAGFRLMIVLRDPYLELAERLLVLKNVAGDGRSVLGERDLAIFGGAIEFLRDVEALDARFCRGFMKRTPPDVLRVLANPLAWQLAAEGDELPPNAVAAALQALSGFAVVGVRDEADAFAAAAGEMFDAHQALPAPHDYSGVIELGGRLRTLSRADAILDKDLDLFESVKQALASAGGTDGSRSAVA